MRSPLGLGIAGPDFGPQPVPRLAPRTPVYSGYDVVETADSSRPPLPNLRHSCDVVRDCCMVCGMSGLERLRLGERGDYCPGMPRAHENDFGSEAIVVAEAAEAKRWCAGEMGRRGSRYGLRYAIEDAYYRGEIGSIEASDLIGMAQETDSRVRREIESYLLSRRGYRRPLPQRYLAPRDFAY